jgi:hypothetical protein
MTARSLLAGAVALTLALAPAGCRYRMIVDSSPRGAEVYVDGIARGKTPVALEEKPGFARTAVISVRKAGFAPQHREVTESEIYHPTAAVIGSWYLVAPLIVWGLVGAPGPSRLKPYYHFQLEPDGGAASCEAAPALAGR